MLASHIWILISGEASRLYPVQCWALPEIACLVMDCQSRLLQDYWQGLHLADDGLGLLCWGCLQLACQVMCPAMHASGCLCAWL